MITLSFLTAALSLGLERIIGYPDDLYRKIGHPVTWGGRLLSKLESALNTPDVSQVEGRFRGFLALGVLLVAGLVPVAIVMAGTGFLPLGWIVEALIGTAFLAQKSMAYHVRAVRAALDRSLPEARQAVSMIVGRETAELDESGVARAALESLAENTSDGIVAPAFWFALAGLPGLVAYKLINTADSMIGHKSERYQHFGWASARLDDLVNLIPSRLCGLLFALAGGSRAAVALQAMARDAPNHVSPNAGWPEAALAETMAVQLGGPRSYSGRLVNLATMGSGRAELNRSDIDHGLKLYRRLLNILIGLFIFLGLGLGA